MVIDYLLVLSKRYNDIIFCIIYTLFTRKSQKHEVKNKGEFDKERYIWPDSEEIIELNDNFTMFNLWRIMTLNGYPKIAHQKDYNSEYEKEESILSKIEKLLGFQNKDGYNDKCYFLI
ncbi:MAG: hypothetical protein ABF289_00795 [Clostridiales bacterium]